ncbi:hypothetical protein T484DRAFT_1760592 [Baffinella frigidus]|nr:hypothetical protein T484DRAFT_1760592 [Cryptophyta sp. CCMP2293]
MVTKNSRDSHPWTPHEHGDASSSLTQTSASSAELFTASKAGKRDLARGRRSSATTRKETIDHDKNMVGKLSSSKGKDGDSPLSRGALSLEAWAARTGVTNHKIKFAEAIKALDDSRMEAELFALFERNVDQGFVRIVQPVLHEERHRAEGCRVLLCITVPAGWKDYTMKNGGVEALFGGMRAHPDAVCVQAEGCRVLRLLAIRGAELGAIETVLASVQGRGA